MLLAVLFLFTVMPSAEARPNGCFETALENTNEPVTDALIDHYLNPTLLLLQNELCTQYNAIPLPGPVEDALDNAGPYALSVVDWTTDEVVPFPGQVATYGQCLPYNGLSGCPQPASPSAPPAP